MARLDGPDLATTACTCKDLQDVAGEERLWENLCHSTWPSTTSQEAQHLISSSPMKKFYPNSYPLISHKKSTHQNTQVSHSDFVSLVDIYYKKKCVLSRVLDGIPEAVNVYDDIERKSEHQRWFADCPFKLDVLDANSSNNNVNINTNDGKVGEDMRLSWILFDKKSGKAVNLSSWKPLLVQRNWPTDGDYVIRFGCVIPVEEKMAECVILAKCRLIEQGCVIWNEISMIIEDMEGAHISGKKSLLVLNSALHCCTSINHVRVENGYNQYLKQKKEMQKRKESKETIAGGVCVSIEILVFIAFCYICTSSF